MTSNQKRNILLLDLDGTLVASSEIALRIKTIVSLYKIFSAHLGIIKAVPVIYVSVRRVLKNSNVSSRTIFEQLVDRCSEKSGLSAKVIESLLLKFYQNEFLNWRHLFFEVEGALDFVKWAKSEGYRCFIFTNPIWPKINVDRRLIWSGFDLNLFDGMTHSENMSVCKPHIEYYKEALGFFKLNGENCIMIGNSQIKDGPAQHLGIKTVIIKTFTKKKWNHLRTQLISS